MRLIHAEAREEVERLLREGCSARQVAGRTGVGRNTVLRYRRLLKLYGTTNPHRLVIIDGEVRYLPGLRGEG